MSAITPTVYLLAQKLRSYGPLSLEEEQELEGAVTGIRAFEAGQDLVVEGTSPDHSSLLVSGFSGRYYMTSEGERQITSLHIPGDFIDLHSFLMHPMDHSIIALTSCQIATVPHESLMRISNEQPRIARLLWLNTLIDGGIHRRWSFCLGSLQAPKQLAHLICEMYLRMEQIGQVENGSFRLPLTQSLLSECLALSSVHVNRTVQALRQTKFVRWERDLITILHWDRLVEMAEFDPTYLRLPKAMAFANM